MASLLGGLTLLNYGYKILSGVTTVSDTINKYLQKPEIPFTDKLELKAIERRLNTLVLPLNHCVIASQKLNSASKLSLESAKELVEELIKFLSDLSPELGHRASVPSVQLKYFRKELDFVSVAVLSTLAMHNYSSESYASKCEGAVSLSALLKASQRLSSMTDITGNICVTKGKFFIRTGNPVLQSKLESEEIKENNSWKQKGISAELVISLNMVLNMYVLQVYVQDKSGPSDSLHMGRRESQTKHSFYINYDLDFRYMDTVELGLPRIHGSSLQDLPVSSEIAKTIKNFVFCWKHTVDPDNELQLIHVKEGELENKEYAFFPESTSGTMGKEMPLMSSSKELTEIDILYLVKLCEYENESLVNLKEKLTEENMADKKKKMEALAEEIQKMKKAAVLPKGEFQKKNLAHLEASDEEIYSLLKNK